MSQDARSTVIPSGRNVANGDVDPSDDWQYEMPMGDVTLWHNVMVRHSNQKSIGPYHVRLRILAAEHRYSQLFA